MRERDVSFAVRVRDGSRRRLARRHSERVDVRLERRDATHEHLGGHVREGADHVLSLKSSARCGGALGGGDVAAAHRLALGVLLGVHRGLERRAELRLGLGEAEIGEAGDPVGAEENVRGFDVAMDVASGVDVGEGGGELLEEEEDSLPGGAPTELVDQGGDGAVLLVGKEEVVLGRVRAGAAQGEDVGMAKIEHETELDW